MLELPSQHFGGYIGYDRLTARILAYGLTVSLGAVPYDYTPQERLDMDARFSISTGGFHVVRASIRLLQAIETEGSAVSWSMVDGLAVVYEEMS